MAADKAKHKRGCLEDCWHVPAQPQVQAKLYTTSHASAGLLRVEGKGYR